MPSCDICGQFISYDDLMSGRAKIILVSPDSEYTKEEYETVCSIHNIPPTGGSAGGPGNFSKSSGETGGMISGYGGHCSGTLDANSTCSVCGPAKLQEIT